MSNIDDFEVFLANYFQQEQQKEIDIESTSPVQVHAPYEISYTSIKNDQNLNQENKLIKSSFTEKMHAEQNPAKEFESSNSVLTPVNGNTIEFDPLFYDLDSIIVETANVGSINDHSLIGDKTKTVANRSCKQAEWQYAPINFGHGDNIQEDDQGFEIKTNEVPETHPLPSTKLNTQQRNHVTDTIQRLGQTRTHGSVSEKDIKMVVNACRYQKLEFEGEIVEIKTFEKKSKQARNKMKNYKCKVCAVMNLESFFTNQDALMKHVKCHFWMILNDKCNWCDKRFPRLDNHKEVCPNQPREPKKMN